MGGALAFRGTEEVGLDANDMGTAGTAYDDLLHTTLEVTQALR